MRIKFILWLLAFTPACVLADHSQLVLICSGVERAAHRPSKQFKEKYVVEIEKHELWLPNADQPLDAKISENEITAMLLVATGEDAQGGSIVYRIDRMSGDLQGSSSVTTLLGTQTISLTSNKVGKCTNSGVVPF